MVKKADKSRYAVLIVDDDPDMVTSLSRILRRKGYETDSASSLDEAFDREDWERYLAVILDRRLPDGHIDKVLPKFRKCDPDIAIIVATGFADLDGAVRALREQVEDYLIKPVDPDVLENRLRGIAARRAAQATIQRLEIEVLNTAEDEKRRIAMELHDGVGAALGGINMLAKALEGSLLKIDGAAKEAELTGKIQQLLGDTIRQVRTLSRGLHPATAEPAGLVHALKDLAMNLNAGEETECRFENRRPVEINDPNVANHLYRIAQEAANNAIRHGSAKQVVIRLETMGERVLLDIEDNGKGFDPQQLPEDRGIGLHNMEYRSRAVLGAIRIDSKPGKGTHVVVQAPLP